MSNSDIGREVINLDYKQMSEEFASEFKRLFDEEKELRSKVAEKLVMTIEQIWPIVEALRENNVYFTHCDLKDVKTLHGIIIGVNHKDYSEIYVCYTSDYVYKVDTYNDTLDVAGMPLSRFLENANLNFAYKGIIETINKPSEILDNIERKIERNKQLLQDLQ